MFRATTCPSSWELTVCMRHWYFSLCMYGCLFCRPDSHGWLLRTIHANGASLFFVCIYLHIGRNLYYGSYNFIHTWSVGVVILFLTITRTFIGYILPWGQISFWGATVITNLISKSIRRKGSRSMSIRRIRGRYGHTYTILRTTLLNTIRNRSNSINSITIFHQTGSNNPLRLNKNTDKISFHPFATVNDILGLAITIIALAVPTLKEPYILRDPDKFTPANPLVTPVHIQPEWYFLFKYAILRSIWNKLGEVAVWSVQPPI